MTTLFIRIGAILLHACLNIMLIGWATDADLSESWASFLLFFMGVLALLWLSLMHVQSFIHYIKNKSQ